MPFNSSNTADESEAVTSKSGGSGKAAILAGEEVGVENDFAVGENAHVSWGGS